MHSTFKYVVRMTSLTFLVGGSVVSWVGFKMCIRAVRCGNEHKQRIYEIRVDAIGF
jgi:hypothetical protein